MYRKFVTYLAAILILIAIPTALVGSIRNAATRVLHPIAAPLIGINLALNDVFQNIHQISSLRNDRENLQRQVVGLQQKLVDNEDLKRQNAELLKELGAAGASQNYKKVFARIIIRPPDTNDRIFTVDVGGTNGIKVGQPAVYQGALVGKVIEVRANSAVIRSINSQQSRIQVWIAETREKGSLIGDGSAVYLEDITQGLSIAPGGVIATSGLGGSLPQSIVVGQIGAIQSKKSDLSQRFLVTLAQDPTTIESVFILLTDTQ